MKISAFDARRCSSQHERIISLPFLVFLKIKKASLCGSFCTTINSKKIKRLDYIEDALVSNGFTVVRYEGIKRMFISWS